MEVMAIEPANLPDVKLSVETEPDEYAKRIAYWRSQALNESGQNVYGLQRSANAVKLLQCERDIVAGIRTIGEQFLTIGKNLWDIQANHLHLSVPMNDDSWMQAWSFEDYVERNFGFKKSTAYALLGVYREFATAKGELKPEYEGFSYSQLVEMLPMDYIERRKVKVDMTVKQIRELRQGSAKKAVPPPTVEPVVIEPVEVFQTSGKVSDYEQPKAVQTSGQAEPVCNDEKSEQSIGFQTSGKSNEITMTFDDDIMFSRWFYDNYSANIYPLTVKYIKQPD